MKKKWGISPFHSSLSPPPLSIYKHLYLICSYIFRYIYLTILEIFKSSKTSLMNPYVYIIWLQQLNFLPTLNQFQKKK